MFIRPALLFALLTAFLPIFGCRFMVATPGDSRLVYITPSSTRGTVITCVEPAIKTPDSYKELLDVITQESMSIENLPDEGVVKYGPYEQSVSVHGATRLLHNRVTRINNMRELLFEICQAYANDLIDLQTYTRFLENVIDKTASLHAMEVLLYQLDQHPYDAATRDRLIDLATEIIHKRDILSVNSRDLESTGAD